MSSQGNARGSVAAGPAVADLVRAADLLGEVAWWQASDGDLAAYLQVLHRVESQVAAGQVAALGEAGRRGLPGAAGFKMAGRWLRSLVPITPHQAAQRADLAQALPGPDLAPTRAALAAGDLAPGHAAVVVRTMNAIKVMPGPVDEATRVRAQDILVCSAKHLDPTQLGKVGTHLEHHLDPDAAERLAKDEDAQTEARCLTLVRERTGMWHLQGLLPPVVGARLSAAIDPLSAPHPAADGTPDPRLPAQRRLDGLDLMTQGVLAARAGSLQALPSRGGSPTRMLAIADLSTLTADLTTHGGQAGIPPVSDLGDGQGWDISPLTTQTLACDAEIVPVLTNGHGRALDVGQTIYPFPPKIRTAIEVRDRHCTWPGCTALTPWCDAHHLTPYRAGGHTSEANGALLCGPHHRHVHNKGHTGRIINGHVHWPPNPTYPPNPGYPPEPEQLSDQNQPTGPDHSDGLSNAHYQRVERAVRDLARQWHQRHHPPPDTG